MRNPGEEGDTERAGDAAGAAPPPYGSISAGLTRSRLTDYGAAMRQRRRAAAGDVDTGADAEAPRDSALSRLDLGTGEGPQGFAMELQTER